MFWKRRVLTRKNSFACGNCWKGARESPMSAWFDWNAIAQASALQVVDCLVEGTLIAIFAGLVLGAGGRQNAGTRFAVWFLALVAIATLPLVGGLWSSHGTGVSAETAHPAIALPSSWAHYLFGAWAVVAVWLLIGVARGLRHLHVLRNSCIPVDTTELDPLVRDTVERNQSSRSATLCTSDLVRVPTAIGFTKPMIAVPSWVMNELSADELNQILLHELAHLRRWDDWTNLAQKLVKALFFFHPAVWWIEQRVSLEREMACDDAVVAETASPRAYAECLTHLAERTFIQRSLILAQAALGRIRQTSLRVAQILDKNRPTGRARTWKPAMSLAAFTLVCVLSTSRVPKLVAFSASQPSAAATPAIATISSPAGRGVALTGMPLAPGTRSRPSIPQVRPLPVKLNLRGPRRSFRISEQDTVSQPPTAEQSRGSMIRRTSANETKADVTPVAFTETLFVVVEGWDGVSPDQPVYQIQWWRITVFHPAADPPGNRIPRKET